MNKIKYINQSGALIKKAEPARLTNVKTNWDGFKKDIEASIELSVSFKTNYELEVKVDCFVEILQGAAWKNTSKQKKTPASYVQTYPPKIKEMIKEKRRATR